jgi:glycosyltransferase involved in cell wall biosynthesis
MNRPASPPKQAARSEAEAASAKPESVELEQRGSHLALMERIRQSEAERLKAEERLEALEDRFFTTLSEQRAQVSLLSKQVAQLNKSWAESVRAAASVSSEKDRLLAHLERVRDDQRATAAVLITKEAELGKLVLKLSEVRGQLDAKDRDIEARVKALQQSERSKETALAAHAKLTIELDSATSEIDRLHGLVQAQDDRIRLLEAELESREARLNGFEAEIERLAECYQTAQEVLSSKQSEIDRLGAELAASRIELDRKSNEVAVLAGELGQQERAAAHSEAKCSELHSALESKVTELTALQSETTALYGSYDRLKADLQAKEGKWKLALDAANKQLASEADKLDTALKEAVHLRGKARALEDLVAEKDLERLRVSERLQSEAERHASAIAGQNSQLAALQHEVVRTRAALLAAERRAEAAKRTIASRLGQALIHASRSWRSAVLLPLTIYRIKQEAKARKVLAREPDGQSNGDWVAVAESIWTSRGLAAAEAHARGAATSDVDLASGLTRLARLVLRSDPSAACRLAREAHRRDPRPFRAKWLAFLLFDAGLITEPHELLLSLPSDVAFKPSERNKKLHIAGCMSLLSSGIQIPRRNPRKYDPVSNNILYVAASALPYHSTGYTVRSQGLLSGLIRQGWNVLCATRLGYPQDREDSMKQTTDVGETYNIEGVQYRTLPGAWRRRTPQAAYLEQSTQAIVDLALEFRPAVIQAASNHESALPALLAARTLGVPFVYEVRGLWEYTAASKIPWWESTERFELERMLETTVATHADRVFTLTAALSSELQRRGVAQDAVQLLPNAVPEQQMLPFAPDQQQRAALGIPENAFVVGYVGSIVDYEGLDDLIRAFPTIQEAVPNARLLIVGDGDALPMLRTQSSSAGLDGLVHFVGRIAASEVQRYYHCMNVVALPRKPFKVCQLVSPLKPLEVMAHGLPLVVSDVDALAEMVHDQTTALVHRAGDPMSLASCLIRIGTDQDLARSLAEAGQKDTLTKRTWSQVAHGLSASLQQLTLKEPHDSDGSAGDSRPAATFELPKLLDLPAGKSSLTPEEKAALSEALCLCSEKGGPAAVDAYVALQSISWTDRLRAFCEIKAAQALLQAGHVQQAFNYADQALLRDPGAGTLKSALRISYNGADLARAQTLLHRLKSTCQSGDDAFLAEVHGRIRLAEWAQQPAQPRTLPCHPRRVLNVLAFSLPYTSVGYATRSHGLAQGIKAAGWDVRAYTRPGFPYDFKPELEGQELPEMDEIDGVLYHRIFGSQRRGTGEVEYLLDAVEHMERVITKEQPQVVHAASNYVTALPALIAARRLGVPFIYEVRGFWEVTRSSRDEAFENTPKYRFMQLFEGLVARNADHVITITSAMKEQLIERGVEANRIAIAYNSVDPDRFSPREKVGTLARDLNLPSGVPVIGYVGSFVDYEGLDDLVSAAARLKTRGVDFRLLLVGDGAVLDTLKQQVLELDLGDRVVLTGRVPHDQVEDYYSLIDIAPFPRKPWEVCELVSPLKPFEAMALQKAVVVSSTRALIEIVAHRNTGLVFEKGNPISLADALQTLLCDQDLRQSIGLAARQWICRHRTWTVAGTVCTNAYLDSHAASRSFPPPRIVPA